MKRIIMTQEDVRDFIGNIDWSTVERTFGSFHSTIIGLFVKAWCDRDKKNTALEGPPSFGKCHPDAILVDKEERPAIVLEVEGLDIPKAFRKLKCYVEEEEMPEVHGVCVAYPIFLRGRKDNKIWRFCKGCWNGHAEDGWDSIIQYVKRVGAGRLAERLTVVKLEREWFQPPNGDLLRTRSEFAQAKLQAVKSFIIGNDGQVESTTLWPL